MAKIRLLNTRDIHSALQLSTQAGWNQVDADWRRLITLWPDNCFGGFDGNQLVVTGTMVTFAPTGDNPVSPAVGWIGMILVEENQRGKGLGTTMMKTLLDAAKQRRVQTVGLDATDMGKPVYEKLGFVTHSIVNRWIGGTTPQRPPSTTSPIPPESLKLSAKHWPGVHALDESAVGAVRKNLLRHLPTELGPEARVVVQNDVVTAFGFARKGRTARYIGPIVAQTSGGASAIFGDLCPPDGPQMPTLIDVPDQSPLRHHLRAAGFTVQRKLTRMLLPLDGTPQPLMSDLVYAGAGFELG